MKHFIKVSNLVVLLCGLCANLDATAPQKVPAAYNVPKSIARLANDILNEITRKMSVYDFSIFRR